MLLRVFVCLFSSAVVVFGAVEVTGKVVEVAERDPVLDLQIARAGGDALNSGKTIPFRVNAADHEIGYLGRGIRGNAVQNGGVWHLGQIFPASGLGISEMRSVNEDFIESVEALPRGKFLKVGDPVPDFVMFDQDGEVFPLRRMRGSCFVINFIFTRCGVPRMCPASSQRMAEMQTEARKRELHHLKFVSVSFDPAFDSPGILRAYGETYGFDFSSFRLLTASQRVVDRLLRLFGLLTVEEDGTINHTMTTLLIDQEGYVVERQEGPDWSAESFLEAAGRL